MVHTNHHLETGSGGKIAADPWTAHGTTNESCFREARIEGLIRIDSDLSLHTQRSGIRAMFSPQCSANCSYVRLRFPPYRWYAAAMNPARYRRIMAMRAVGWRPSNSWLFCEHSWTTLPTTDVITILTHERSACPMSNCINTRESIVVAMKTPPTRRCRDTSLRNRLMRCSVCPM